MERPDGPVATLDEIVEVLDARLVAGEPRGVAIDRIVAGDRISDLLERASPTTLVVTNLSSRQLVALADLMDLPAICFLSGHEPVEEVVDASRLSGTLLVTSPLDMFETCGRIFVLLEGRRGDP